MDWYWVNTCVNNMPLRYSDFNIGKTLRTNKDAIKERHDWIGTDKERLNKYIADNCNGIITGLYEYWICYHPAFPEKTTYIPFPIHIPKTVPEPVFNGPLKIFIGINKTRNEYKGTDIMLHAATDIAHKYPQKVELRIAESVPFDEYEKMMNGSDIILDQLYSYTPSMNPLLAMSKGIICVGGGEEENYDLINEHELRPIINVQPCYDSVYRELEQLIAHPERIITLKSKAFNM